MLFRRVAGAADGVCAQTCYHCIGHQKDQGSEFCVEQKRGISLKNYSCYSNSVPVDGLDSRAKRRMEQQ